MKEKNNNFSDEQQLISLKKENLRLKRKLRNLEQIIKERDFFDKFSKSKQTLIKNFINCTIDSKSDYVNTSLESILNGVKKQMGIKVAAIYNDDIKKFKNNLKYDQVLASFIHGSGGIISDWNTEEHTDNCLVIRGLSSTSQKAIKHCWETKRNFYAIDTGYFGNIKTKNVHRVTKNSLQNLGPIVARPFDRIKQFNYKYKKFSSGTNILLVPPSEKVMKFFDQPSPDVWSNQIIEDIKKYTDRPVKIRLKPPREERVSNNTIQSALAEDVHCLITYNSIAAIEALMEGKPAIVLGENAASVIADKSLDRIENPTIPCRDEMDAFMAHLSYCQFTIRELTNGYAWDILNENS